MRSGRTPEGFSRQHQDEGDGDQEFLERGALHGGDARDPFDEETRGFEQGHHHVGAEQRAGRPAGAARGDGQEDVDRDQRQEEVGRDVEREVPVERAGESGDGGRERECLRLEAQHGFAGDLRHLGVLADGAQRAADRASGRRGATTKNTTPVPASTIRK